MNRLLIPLLLTLSVACASVPAAPPATPVAAPPCNPGHSILNSTLWMQTSAEYRAIAMQTFATARRSLDAALADPSWVGAIEETNEDPSEPPAVIVDLDETTLDNTPFEARVIKRGITFDKALWKEWTAEGTAPAIPGAAEFLAYAKSRGVTTFYVTNRDLDEEPGTRSNLERLGFPMSSSVETLLMRGTRPEWKSDKSSRRAHVAAMYRVLLLVGDDLNDFASAYTADRAEREKITVDKTAWWGTRWFMLPNAMYGSWDRAAVGSNGTPCEQIQRKVDVLQAE